MKIRTINDKKLLGKSYQKKLDSFKVKILIIFFECLGPRKELRFLLKLEMC